MRHDMPKLLRLQRVIERLSSWCSWRCPLGFLLLTLAGHFFHTPLWWRTTCDIIAVILFALIFFSYGFTIAIGAIVVERPRRWFESIGLSLGVLGGVAVVVLGIVGAWMFFRSFVLGL
jgi:hypothetical protein